MAKKTSTKVLKNRITKVKKRDGSIVEFDPQRIHDAIFKAITATGEGDGKRTKKLTKKVISILNRRFKKEEIPHVEQIQDIIEEILILEGLVDTARAYILYREQRRRIREAVKVAEEAVDRIDQYLEKLDWEVQENANMAFSLQGLNHYGVSYIVKKYWLNKIYPKEIREANESGDFHIHNLDTLATYCCGWDLYDLLLKGFRGVPGKVETKPAKHFRTALGQLVNFFYTLQGECYSSDTQILTDSGWKYFYEVKKDDEIFTLNNKTNEIELQKPVRFYRFDYDGELYNFKSKKLDLLVTPNHNMVVDQYCPYCKKGKYHRKFVKAKDFNPNTHFIPKNSTWKGRERKHFVLPGIKIFQYRNFSKPNSLLYPSLDSSQVRFFSKENTYGEVLSLPQVQTFTSQPIWKYEIKEIKPKKILIEDWLAFFGFWLAEGCTSLRKRKRKGWKNPYYEYQVRISQNEGKTAEKFERVLQKLPFNYIKKQNGKKIEFEIFNKQLFLYLRQFGNKETKFIPKEIKDLSRDQLKILFNWMMKGDGYIGNGNVEYSTKSKKLADDLQEIALKLGWSANIYPRIKGDFQWYDVGISRAKHFRFKSKERSVKRVKYQGKVYCLEVPNHTLYVRREGKAVWCGNSAGAQAVSNFDTLLAPFIRYDNLNYQQVKQALQEFLFNMAIPTRVGFQCLSDDTEILTSEGWKGYNEVKKGDVIKTFNLKTREIENKKTSYIFKREYRGIMYRLRNRIQDQLISPEHRVVRRKFYSNKYVLEPIEDVMKLKSPFIIPIAGKNSNSEANISDEQIKLMAWIISEGSVERPGKHRCCHRVSIYQSKIKNRKNYDEIINLLRYYNLEYANHPATSLGEEVQQIRLNAGSSRKIHEWFGTKENVHFIPEYLLNLSERQSRLFLETYLRGDGKEGCKIATSDLRLLNDLQIIIVNAGYGFTVRNQGPSNIGKKDIYILRIIRHKETYIPKIEKVNYEGIIWCPHTENGTLIARRKGKVFITGNCPFSNITLDLRPSPVFAKQPVIIGGGPQKETYQEFEEEMKIFDRALYETMLEGDKSGRPFHFPIPTINITKDFPWEDPAFDPIFEASGKYGTNYFANYINSEMKPDDVRSMCCRLRLNLTDLYNRGGGGLFGSGSLTGSTGVVTINLPRIGYLSKTKKEFFERLGKMMDLAKESLEIKRKTIEDFIEKGLYPYSRFYLQGIKKMRGAYYANHFSTIGLVGMNEALLNFIGENIASKRGRKFALEIMDFMRKKLVRYQKETGNIYNLEQTPAESTAFRLALKDKEKYPDIITAGTKKVPYYTNSSQLPVNYTDDPFEALKLQDEITCKYTGGSVLHLFLGERVSDVETVKNLIKKIFENFKLPYITLTPTFSICPSHGYLEGEHFECPKCTIKQPCEVYSRIVGYYRPVQQYNVGKIQEFHERKVFKIKRKYVEERL